MSKLTYVGETFKEENPKAFEKMVKAMNMSNGKVNNAIGMTLALSDNTEPEDIARLAVMEMDNKEDDKKFRSILGSHIRYTVWEKNSYGTREDTLNRRKNKREKEFNDKFRYTFEDTFLYRIMKKFGMITELEKEKQYSGNSYKYCVGDRDRYCKKLSDSNYVQPILMYYHASEDLRNIIINDEILNQMWTEQAKIQKEIYKPWSTREQELHPITSTNEEWRKFQTEHIIKEFDQLAHMPLDLKEKMNGWTEYFGDKEHNCYYCREKLSPIIMHTILNGFRYPAEDKVIELIREAYSVMDYIGIGVCWNYVESEQFEDDGKGGIKYDENGKEVRKNIYRVADRRETSFRVSAMLKKVCGNMRKFVSDIKKGFDAHDVRELVIEDLNAWCTAQARGHWQFFERDDAPEEYPDLCKKKKAKKNSNKTDSLELNETELEVVKMFKERNNDNEQS